jgi:hypothetical protein
MRGRIAGMSDWSGELLLGLFLWGAMVSFGVALLMLRDTQHRFSLRWLLAFTTFVAMFFGSVAALVHFIGRGFRM